MVTLWVFTKTNNEEKARLVVARLSATLGASLEVQSIEPYPKIGGHKVRAVFAEVGESWPEVVLYTIQKAQEIGRGWILSGKIPDEIDMISNESNVSGIEMIHIQKVRA